MIIISGGQTGADRAALDVAIKYGGQHHGYCPKGRRAEDGAIPARYNLTETASKDYRVRTEKNILAADATVIFMPKSSAGSRLTETMCAQHEKPCLVLGQEFDSDVDYLVEWLAEHKPARLNIAGNRESVSPGVAKYTTLALEAAFKALASRFSLNSIDQLLAAWPGPQPANSE